MDGGRCLASPAYHRSGTGFVATRHAAQLLPCLLRCGEQPQPASFLNGIALNAGQEREPVLLTEHAVPGDNLLVAVQVTGHEEEKARQIRAARIAFVPSDRPDPNLLGQE